MKQPKTQIKKEKSKTKQEFFFVSIPVVKGHRIGQLETRQGMESLTRNPNWEAERIYKWLSHNLHVETYDKLLELLGPDMVTHAGRNSI